MTKVIKLSLFWVVCTMSFFSCKSEDRTIEESMVGEWDVYASKINKKNNDFVKEGWFEFSAENTVISNVFPDKEAKSFKVDSKRLIIEMEPPFDLLFNEFSNDSMHIEGKLSYYYMEYFLAKRK